jgi:flagellar FliJ protein
MKIKECEQAIEIMKAKISQQEAVVRNARHKLELARIRLNEAIINRKTQEKLKENEFQEYILEFEAEERKEVDELNSYNYTGPRKSKEDE